jgi:hypothetical protein
MTPTLRALSNVSLTERERKAGHPIFHYSGKTIRLLPTAIVQQYRSGMAIGCSQKSDASEIYVLIMESQPTIFPQQVLNPSTYSTYPVRVKCTNLQ